MTKTTDDKLAFTIAELVDLSTISRTEIYEDIKAGKLIAKKHGARTFVTAEAARTWLEEHPDA